MSDPLPAPSAVVLLVEDEVLVRMVAADILFEAGFHVLEAVSAAEALTVLDVRDDIRVIVTDINMPGELSGLDLSVVAAKRDAAMAIVITSGREWPSPEEMPDGARWLPKPYTPESLVDAVRRAIDGTAGLAAVGKAPSGPPAQAQPLGDGADASDCPQATSRKLAS
jgi:two-component system, response regulator PdtaR